MLVGNKKGLHGHFVKGLRLKLTQFAVKNELVVREMHPWSVCSYFCVSPSDF